MLPPRGLPLRTPGSVLEKAGCPKVSLLRFTELLLSRTANNADARTRRKLYEEGRTRML